MPREQHPEDQSPDQDADLFSERDLTLSAMGFDSYAEYLSSDLWDWIKQQLKNGPEAKHCICCRSPTGLTWHHRNYDLPVLTGNFSNTPPQIVRLCQACHKAIHRDGETWFALDQVDLRLDELQLRFDSNFDAKNREKLPTTKYPSEFDDYREFTSPGGF